MEAIQERDGDGAPPIEQVESYLAVVEAFRHEGCEPEWRPEDEFVRPRRRRKHGRTKSSADNRR
jgi:hypothetical protein